MEKNFNNKLKIIFCINNFQKGGAEKQLNYICNYLSLKYEIHIFIIGEKKISYNFNKNIKIYKLNKFFFFFQFFSKIINIKPQVVFFVLPKSYFLFGSLMILFPKIKKILMRRSLNYYHRNFLYKYFEIFLHNFTHFFVCNSYAAKNNLIDFENVPKKKIYVIDNFIKFKKKNYSKKNKIFNILCIANFHSYKGHLLLLQTISYLQDLPINLYLYGENKDITKQMLINTSRNLNILDKVFFIKKINKYFSFPNFSLGASFSKTESFPNSILEYFSLGLPVIAYDTGDVKKLVGNQNGKIFKTRNPKLISKYIRKIYFDKKINSKSKYSYLILKKYTDERNTLKKYEDLIEEIKCVEL